MLIPNYYEKFRCKCGECRHCCCSDWGITVSYLEYCKFLSLECSENLRKKLDCAFFILPDADSERYAELKINYLGDCPLRAEDGLCSLQCECGEDAIPTVCKMYPKNTFDPIYGEGACACSCEKTVELLLEETEGLTLKDIPSKTADEKKMSPEERSSLSLQLALLDILRDRTIPFKERFFKASGLFGLSVDKKSYPDEFLFEVLADLLASPDAYSKNFSAFSKIAEKNVFFENKEKRIAAFDEAKIRFERNFPLHEIYFENIIANHMLFERFPYSAKGESPVEKFSELCLVYVLVRFVAVAYTKTDDKTALVDCLAGLFRCFEHSGADRIAEKSLEGEGESPFSLLFALIDRF